MPRGTVGLVLIILLGIAALRLRLVDYLKTLWVLAFHDVGMKSI